MRKLLVALCIVTPVLLLTGCGFTETYYAPAYYPSSYTTVGYYSTTPYWVGGYGYNNGYGYNGWYGSDNYYGTTVYSSDW